jgi:hypothetical protein
MDTVHEVGSEAAMKTGLLKSSGRCLAYGLGFSTLSYAAYAGLTWLRFGHPKPSKDDERDELLDRFMPDYEIAERHHARVCAPAAITLDAACEMDLQQSAIVRLIFKTREWVMRADPDVRRSRGFLSEMRSIGWGDLAETPGREIVMGAVTQPWMPNVVFRPLPPEDFLRFDEPGYVKIVWTLRADPAGAGETVFRTETRAVTTDPVARSLFRRYWSFVSPGVVLIRWMILGALKTQARRKVNSGLATGKNASPSFGASHVSDSAS